jgi:hypothetical protein
MFGSVEKYVLPILFMFALIGTSSGQILQNAQDLEKVRKGVISIYNCEFEEAQAISKDLEKKYANSAIIYLLKGITVYWQDYPVIPGSKSGQQFEDYLHKGLELAEEKLKANESDAENLLLALGSVGFLLLYYADNGQSGKVISLAPKTYQWVMKSFDFTRTYKDFYFITGLYNYYREAYANAHPIYKPVMVFFPHGNKKLGLQQIKIAADSSIFLPAESMTFLSGIYQDFERDPVQAIFYSRKLKDAFTGNPQFKAGYIRDLLVIKKYGEAESLLNGMHYASLNKYYQAIIEIFKGIIQEKKYKNKKSAEELYWSGIKKAEDYGQFGAEYIAYAYHGLSRINGEEGNYKAAKQYHKKARELSSFDHVNFDH